MQEGLNPGGEVQSPAPYPDSRKLITRKNIIQVTFIILAPVNAQHSIPISYMVPLNAILNLRQ